MTSKSKVLAGASAATRVRARDKRAIGKIAGVASSARRGSRARKRQNLRPEFSGARTALLLNGVPEDLLREAELRGSHDWRPLAGALDDLFMATGGDRGVRIFW